MSSVLFRCRIRSNLEIQDEDLPDAATIDRKCHDLFKHLMSDAIINEPVATALPMSRCVSPPNSRIAFKISPVNY